MSAIVGRDFMLFMDKPGDTPGVLNKPLCYAQTVTIHLEAEMLEATTPPDGGFRNFRPGLKMYTLQADGIADELEALRITIEDLQGYIISGARLAWKAFNTKNNQIVYSGFVYLVNVDESSPFDNFNGFTATMQGDGALKIEHAPPVSASRVYYGTQANANNPTDFTKFILADPAAAITISYGVVNTPQFFWMAHLNTFADKTNWKDINDGNNSGKIGEAGSLFNKSVIQIGADNYTLYMMAYPSQFTPPNQGVIFS